MSSRIRGSWDELQLLRYSVLTTVVFVVHELPAMIDRLMVPSSQLLLKRAKCIYMISISLAGTRRIHQQMSDFQVTNMEEMCRSDTFLINWYVNARLYCKYKCILCATPYSLSQFPHMLAMRGTAYCLEVTCAETSD